MVKSPHQPFSHMPHVIKYLSGEKTTSAFYVPSIVWCHLAGDEVSVFFCPVMYKQWCMEFAFVVWNQPEPEIIIDHRSPDFMSLRWRNPCIYGSYFIHPRTSKVIHIKYPRRSLFLYDVPPIIPEDNREFPELGTRIHIPHPELCECTHWVVHIAS